MTPTEELLSIGQHRIRETGEDGESRTHRVVNPINEQKLWSKGKNFR
jgi:hypothetical protein